MTCFVSLVGSGVFDLSGPFISQFSWFVWIGVGDCHIMSRLRSVEVDRVVTTRGVGLSRSSSCPSPDVEIVSTVVCVHGVVGFRKGRIQVRYVFPSLLRSSRHSCLPSPFALDERIVVPQSLPVIKCITILNFLRMYSIKDLINLLRIQEILNSKVPSPNYRFKNFRSTLIIKFPSEVGNLLTEILVFV